MSVSFDYISRKTQLNMGCEVWQRTYGEGACDAALGTDQRTPPAAGVRLTCKTALA